MANHWNGVRLNLFKYLQSVCHYIKDKDFSTVINTVFQEYNVRIPVCHVLLYGCHVCSCRDPSGTAIISLTERSAYKGIVCSSMFVNLSKHSRTLNVKVVSIKQQQKTTKTKPQNHLTYVHVQICCYRASLWNIHTTKKHQITVEYSLRLWINVLIRIASVSDI